MSKSISAATTANAAVQSHIREGLVTALLGLSMVLVIMNTMMFNMALPSVAVDFGLSASSTSWIVTGYSIVFAIASITYSRLSDFVPIRRLFVFALVSFSAAAIAGLFSDSFLALLLVRLVQASGAGAIPALSLVLVTRYVPQERRGKAMAMIMSAASLGLGLGPVVGGAIVEYWGWHYLFAITAVTIVLVPLLAALLPKEKPTAGTFDFAGALFVGIGTTGLLLFLTNHSVIALAAGAVSLVLFVVRIRKARDPFVQPALFSNRGYMLLSVVGMTAYLSSFSTLYLMPQILVGQFELSAIESGLVLFPGTLLAFFVSRRVGKFIDRQGNRTILRFVPWIVLASVILFALLSGTSYVAIMIVFLLLSVGFTIISSSVSNEMSRVLKPAQIGSGLGLFQLLQFFSGAFAVAASASAMSWQRELPPFTAYGNIYWGLTVIVLVSIGCAYAYTRGHARSGM